MTEGWPEVLDDLERHLQEQARLVDAEPVCRGLGLRAPAGPARAARSRWPPGGASSSRRAQGLVEEGERLREETARRVTSRRRLAFFRQPTAAYVDRLA